MIAYILLGLLIWTVASVWWFISHLGDKFREVGPIQNVLEHIFGIPVFAIILILSPIGFFRRLRRR